MPRNYHPITRTLEQVTQPLDTKTITATKAVQEAFTGSSNFYFEDPDTKWCTIHNGINVDDFNAKVKSADTSDICENYELNRGPVLLNIGRYTPAKSQIDLIPVMKKVVQHIPYTTLLIVGYGDLERELIERIDRAGLSDNVHVTGRAESVHRYYKAADLFVLSSRTEGFGIVNLEAMCAELPIVATDIPAVREIVNDGQTGELVQVGNHQQMADNILSILMNSEKKQAYSRCGLGRAQEHFDVSQMAAHYLNIYSKAARR
jgi:glycosyltransferase involved in cell wall biosynthesis